MFAVHSLADSQQRVLQTGPTLWAIVELTHSHIHTHIGKLQEIQILKQIVFDAPVPQCSRCHFEPAAQQEVAPWLERLLANPPPPLPLSLLFLVVQLFACGRVGDYSDNSIRNRRKTFGPNCPLSVLDLVINSLPEKFSLNKKELSESERGGGERERERYVNVDFLQCNFDRLQRCLLNLLLHF